MKLFHIAVLAAVLMTSSAALAEETRVALNVSKQELPTRSRVELKRRAAPQRVQKRTSRPAKYDASLEWMQLG